MTRNRWHGRHLIRKAAIATALFLALGGLVVLMLHGRDSGTPPESGSPIETATVAPGELDAPKVVAQAAAVPPSQPPLTNAAVLTEQNYREISMLASSVEDALWLQAHGYPNSAQIRDYQTLPLGELEALAAKGDLVAKVMAGTRLALAYKNPDGIQMLQQAATEGSVYALSNLAHTYANRGPQHDLALAEAYRRLALTRGDWSQAALPIDARLSARDSILAEANYLRLAREFAQARFERHLPPFETEIRPGFDEFLARLQEVEVVESVDPGNP